MLAKGYSFQGLAGIILLSAYFFPGQKKIKNFGFLNLVAATVITLFLWVALVNTPSNGSFFLYSYMLGPLNIVSINGFPDHCQGHI